MQPHGTTMSTTIIPQRVTTAGMEMTTTMEAGGIVGNTATPNCEGYVDDHSGNSRPRGVGVLLCSPQLVQRLHGIRMENAPLTEPNPQIM